VEQSFVTDDAVMMPPLGDASVDTRTAADPHEHDALLWLARLEKQLSTQAAKADKFQRYYEGDHPLPELPFRKDVRHRYEKKFLDLLKKSRSNWMRLVIDAEAERMSVEGFRFKDDNSDSDAWAIWQRNHLDAESEQVHTEGIKSGTSFVSVWPGSNGPMLMPEHPSEVTIAYEAGNRRQRCAALKLWKDEWTGEEFATVYMPSFVAKFKRGGTEWARRNVKGEDWPLPNPLGAVPIVSFQNRPQMITGGVSEIDDVTDIQDRINAALFGRMLAMDFASAPQRWATGIEIEEDDDGNPITPFEIAVDRLWTSEDPDAKFGQFKESDLSGYIKAVEQDIQHLAAITRTPPHYLLGQSGAFPSGESLKSTETGLVAKVRRQQRYFGEAWEEVLRLAFKADGDKRSGTFDAETIWSDPESRTEAEHIDAAVKKRTIGVPDKQLQEDIGYTPQQIARFPEMLAAQTETQPGTPVE